MLKTMGGTVLEGSQQAEVRRGDFREAAVPDHDDDPTTILIRVIVGHIGTTAET